MASDAVVLINPTGTPRERPDDAQVELPDLSGRTVGFFSNNKPNATAVLGRVAEALNERFAIRVRHYTKQSPSVPAPTDLLDDMARRCDAVVVASLD